MQEIDGYSTLAARYIHSGNVVMCIIYSIYTKLANEKEIHGNEIDQTLWKLGQWKDNNMKTNSKTIVKNFTILQ